MILRVLTVPCTVVFETKSVLDAGIMAETKLSIHRFNGQNYQLWKRQMEIYMAENGLKKYVDGSTPKPAADADVPAWIKKDAEAQAFLKRGLELDQLRYVADCTTAADMWARLRTVHAERSDQSVQVLLNQFINAKLDPGASMADHIAKIVSLAQRLKNMQMEQNETVVIAKILSSLPEKFDNVRTAWYAVPRDQQKLDKLTDHLVNEESLLNMRSQNVNTVDEQTAYYVKGKRGPANNRKSRGGNSRNFVKSGLCHFCKKQAGHWARDCPEKKEYL